MKITSEYLVSAQIIEFFYFFFVLLMFIIALILKYYLKRDIHITKKKQKKYEEHPNQQEQEQSNQYFNISFNQVNAAQKLQQIAGNAINVIDQAINNKKEEISKEVLFNHQNIQKEKINNFLQGFENIVDYYMPQITIIVLLIGNFATYTFAIFCFFAILICVILFNEWQIQSGCGEECPKCNYFNISLIPGLFRFLYHIWVFSLCLTYLIYDQAS